jgi:hypothetical protein
VTGPEARARPGAARAIYGLILATAVVSGLSEDSALSSRELLAGVAVTTLVFWLAHVYAEALGRQLGRDRPLGWTDLRDVAREESSMIQAAVPTLLALGLGWIGVLSKDASVDLAIGLGVAALVACGFLIARHTRLSPLGTLVAVSLTGVLGLAIVALKVVIK